jgi:pimeloyl-ACP methyl ester carboxylesterase
MEERNIFINGLKVNYKFAGSGPVILILHGWGGSSDSWIKVSEFLAQKGFRVISPDFPGFGKTKIPERAWGLNDFVDWLKNFTEKLNLEEFFLLGHSFGGRVAIKFSIFYPEKAKKLILVNSAGIKPEWGAKEKIVFQISKIGNALFSKNHFFKFKDEARNFFYRMARIKDYSKAKGAMKETMKKILEEDLLPELSKIQNETLILWGEKDKIVPLKYAYLFKEKIKNSQLEILPKIGHSPHLEDPEKLTKVILPFLRP